MTRARRRRQLHRYRRRLHAKAPPRSIVGAAIKAHRRRLDPRDQGRQRDDRDTARRRACRGAGCSPRATTASRASATDYIDIYYLHKDDPRHADRRKRSARSAISSRSGKIRYFGVSNYRGWRIAEFVSECEAQGVPLPVVCQPYYNLLNRTPEVEILPACDHYGIGVAPYSPVARGVLTGKYAPGAPLPEGSRAARGDRGSWRRSCARSRFAIAQKLAAHAGKTGRTLTQFALAWLWANQIVTSVIAGPRTFEQWQRLRRRARHDVERRGRSARRIRWSRRGIRRRPATTIRSIRSSGGSSTDAPRPLPHSRVAPRARRRSPRTAAGSPAATAGTTSARRTRTTGCTRN